METGVWRLFIGLGSLLGIIVIMSFYMIKADRERVDEANARLLEQAPLFDVADSVEVGPIQLLLKNATLEEGTSLKLELMITNKSDQLLSIEADDFILFDGKNNHFYRIAAPNPLKVSENESTDWVLEYEGDLGEQFALQIVSEELNEGQRAIFRLNLEQ